MLRGGDVRILTGIATGITLMILAHILWKPALSWALSGGDTCNCHPKETS